jgi:hypothetical protein
MVIYIKVNVNSVHKELYFNMDYVQKDVELINYIQIESVFV